MYQKSEALELIPKSFPWSHMVDGVSPCIVDTAIPASPGRLTTEDAERRTRGRGLQ